MAPGYNLEVKGAYTMGITIFTAICNAATYVIIASMLNTFALFFSFTWHLMEDSGSVTKRWMNKALYYMYTVFVIRMYIHSTLKRNLTVRAYIYGHVYPQVLGLALGVYISYNNDTILYMCNEWRCL